MEIMVSTTETTHVAGYLIRWINVIYIICARQLKSCYMGFAMFSAIVNPARQLLLTHRVNNS